MYKQLRIRALGILIKALARLCSRLQCRRYGHKPDGNRSLSECLECRKQILSDNPELMDGDDEIDSSHGFCAMLAEEQRSKDVAEVYERANGALHNLKVTKLPNGTMILG